MVLGHQEVVAQQDEKGPLHRVQGARNRVAHAALLHLFMHQHVHAMAWVEVLEVDLGAEGGQLAPPLFPCAQVLSGS